MNIFNYVLKSVKNLYGKNLISLVVFGSYARGTQNLNSDIDILIILKKSKKSRRDRLLEFIDNVKEDEVEINPIIKTIDEVKITPLMYNIALEGKILFDRNDFFLNFRNMILNLNIKKYGVGGWGYLIWG